jgi:glycine betaine/proline transport system ATP-binding protein
MAAEIIPLPAAGARVAGAAPTVLACVKLWKVFGVGAAEFREGRSDLSGEEMARRGWVPAVRDVSIEIGKGEIFVVMGLSGSGKSTLVRLMSRLVEPTAGEVRLDGRDLLTLSERELIEVRRTKMGMVFQHFALLPNLTVLGNVAFPLQVRGLSREARERRARELVSLVGLEGREDRFPSELSGGQQQRVGIARSLASDPEVWFLDEPFSALDPLIRADLQDELLRLQAKLAKSIVFITHDLDEAIKLADRIAIMDQGRVVQIATPEELVLRPADDYVRRFTSKIPLAKVVRAGSIATRGDDGPRPLLVVEASETIEAIAPRILDVEGPIAVASAGTIIGQLDRRQVLGILAGLHPG